MKNYCISIIFVCFGAMLFAQVDSTLYNREQQLKVYLNDLRVASDNVSKEQKNQIFKEYLAQTIEIGGAINYPFAELKTMGSIKSPDNTFRLFNWNVEQDDRTNKYYCYILRFDDKKKEWKTIELVDNSSAMPPRPDEILDEKNWYGALYYKIIPIEKSNKTLYTILGWDGNVSSNTKLVDVISFNGNKVKLGNAIFKMNDGLHKRLFFEHSKKAFMSLNYDEARNRIVFDHLSPETPSLIGFYEYYVPDFSYDELIFKNNKWIVQEDIVGVNNKSEQAYTLKFLNKKDGDVVTKEVKNKWVDPSDKNAPGGANTHTASLPENESNTSAVDAKNSQAPKIKNKKEKKNEFSMNPYLKDRKKRKK